MKRKVFFLSDSTGMTAENLGRSLLVQFPEVQFEGVTRPFIDSVTKAEEVAKDINQAAQTMTDRPIVIDTIVSEDVSRVIRRSDCFYIDIFSTFLAPLEKELKTHSSLAVGHPTIIKEDGSPREDHYMERIKSVHFALANDDGQHLNHYDEADIVLIGVSRTGKTPTSIYLGMQFGIKVANYPLIPDDLQSSGLPKALQHHKRKLFGLTIKPKRLSQIRNERKPNSTYASLRNCMEEVRIAEGMYRQFNIPSIDTTQLSVEEIAARMLQKLGIERRVSSL